MSDAKNNLSGDVTGTNGLTGNLIAGGRYQYDPNRPIVDAKELARVLKILLDFSNTSYDMRAEPAVYRTRAQSMRIAADRIEAEDRAVEEARQTLAQFEGQPDAKA